VKKIILVCVALCVAAAFSFAQTQKLAYVDSETILKELKEAQDARKDVDNAVKEWTDELEKMGKDLEQNLQEYQKKESLFNPQKKEEEQKKLGEQQQKIRELQSKRQQDAAQLRDKKFAPIRERVLKSIEAVAKEGGFTFVFDKLNETILLYADVKYDLTYLVIDRLKRGSATKTTK
jgi:outer membrane protein